MEKATVVPCTGYNVVVGYEFWRQLPLDLIKYVPASKYIIITDLNVQQHYGDELLRALNEALPDGIEALLYAVAPGEASKSRETKRALEDWMLARGFDRKSCIVALGGGVVGDLAGFVAATFMRGINFVQVPTTLLAMVDSSIGGKTGIDTPAGKNLVGAFHRPKRVYADLAFLSTLPEREFNNGMAEVIKAGAIYDAALFQLLELQSEQIRALDPDLLTQMVLAAVRVKVTVVLQDEKEAGLRAILNFGHSIGHGIEALLTGHWLHGECVAVGMIKETEVARARGILSPDALNRLLSCCQAYHLPTTIPTGVSHNDVLHKMAVDKKNERGRKHIVFLRAIGDAGQGAEPVEDDLLLRIMAPAVEVVPHGPIAGTIRVPGSKSISNRVLLMAALGRGVCRLRGLLHSDDTKVMIAALRKLGVRIEFEDNGHVLLIQGCDGKLQAAGDNALFLANAGTASRFLTSACCLASSGHSLVTGVKRMHERPIGDLVEALRAVDCAIDYLDQEGYPPLRVHGTGLPGGTIQLAATVSSQYVSSILLAAPYAQAPVTLELVGEVVSQPYIDMTVALMKQFGVDVEAHSGSRYVIPNTGYQLPDTFDVESDASSASYPLAMAAISGGRVTVAAMGSGSLQGDAAFCRVLERMGCEVEQTSDATTVVGCVPGTLQPVDVDMGDITDTFMTAAVLMATCPKGSRSTITNIANQRVKECNRITAMLTELGKCGVHCEELETGLAIFGQGADSPASLKRGVPVECYRDHRIAMSFGVLGCLWPNVQITDKDCTDKTYPSFWDDVCNLQGHRNAVLHASIEEQTSAAAGSAGHAGARDRQSVCIIGMRGAGKSTLARAAAAHLGYQFLDLDVVLEERCEGGIKTFVEQQGWPAFRDAEERVLADTLRAHPTGAVIACGGGIVEREANCAVLQATKLPIIWLDRPLVDIERYLAADGVRPAYLEEVAEVYARRQPRFAACADWRFPVAEGATDLLCWKQHFGRLCALATGLSPRVPAWVYSKFVCLTQPDVRAVPAAQLAEIVANAQAVELRVDLLASLTEDYIATQVAAIRSATKSPIIFTVRTEPQGGRYAGSPAKYAALLRVGIRLGCEIVDVEADLPSDELRQLTRLVPASTTLLGSLHFLRPCGGAQELTAALHNCALGGRADLLKVIFTADTPGDALALVEAYRVLRGTLSRPAIVMAMGQAGKLTRVLNDQLTPVTHRLLTTAAAPGQLTAQQLDDMRAELGLFPKRNFFLFGEPIALSASPLMHNTVFADLKLPYTYQRCSTSNALDAITCLQGTNCGGGSVTMPLKERLGHVLVDVDVPGRVIGAVNTIVKDSQGQLHGFNTDYLGILAALRDAGAPSAPRAALVLGAGGTARAAVYALQQLGCHRIVVVNRTAERALALAEQFRVEHAADLMASTAYTYDIVVSTVAATANLTVPEVLLTASRPVVLDAAYIPYKTALILQAEAAGCRVAHGIDMLLHQGLAQAQLFCGGTTLSSELQKKVWARVHACYQAMLAMEPAERVMPNI
ncbi:uncharacterized protein MONBRDRAFT_32780 [Monosiga brevicollis MX1]|uniref:Pentafunctional AROM polypeptide n=1 Tax=Monosiga brevicollis TaxID=81824 RepID=A9V1N3_MONBE|nr:uncharacterized protein MONBRDRAFT_32780 [Monosiga brevicollis MX1]EDQ88471.1 predicted protein [Monosiga brevicollis MX1]|eukprot:XP_001746575.1 hypothetical protein [Monosiga brevicollis MX1]